MTGSTPEDTVTQGGKIPLYHRCTATGDSPGARASNQKCCDSDIPDADKGLLKEYMHPRVFEEGWNNERADRARLEESRYKTERPLFCLQSESNRPCSFCFIVGDANNVESFRFHNS